MKYRELIYITNTRLPTEKAHGLAAMKLAEAMADLGLAVTMVHPWRINALVDDPYSYYEVKRNFRIVTLPSVDFLWLGVLPGFFYPVQLFSFSVMSAFYLLLNRVILRRFRSALVFSHDHIPLYFAAALYFPVFYDIHDFPGRTLFYRSVLSWAMGCAVQTKNKVDRLFKEYGVPARNIVYWPNGTDAERFVVEESKHQVRTDLGLPKSLRIAMYVGHLFAWKGVHTFARASRFLPDSIKLFIVGGTDKDRREFLSFLDMENLKSVVSVPFQPRSAVPLWMAAADVLVLPNTARDPVSFYDTSPMKLFEYMAANRPIVASDIPSIREIIDKSTAFFFEPDNPESLARTIMKVFEREEESTIMAERARVEVSKYTWIQRAKKIVGFIDS